MTIKTYAGVTTGPFDLAAALAGAPVVTADHQPISDLRYYPASEDGPEQVTGALPHMRIVADASGKAQSVDPDLYSFRMIVE